MPRFSAAPVEQVAPQRKKRNPSQRAQIQQQYQTALQDAVVENGQALVVHMDADDKPLTIRNRINRAAERLGIEDIVVRRRGDRIIAYRSESGEQD